MGRPAEYLLQAMGNFLEKIIEHFDQNEKNLMRIEHSPNSKIIWKIKKRNTTNITWEEIYSKVNYINVTKFKRTLESNLNQPQ